MSHFILSILSARCLLLLHCFLLLLALCVFLNFNNILSARFERYSEQAILCTLSRNQRVKLSMTWKCWILGRNGANFHRRIISSTRTELILHCHVRRVPSTIYSPVEFKSNPMDEGCSKVDIFLYIIKELFDLANGYSNVWHSNAVSWSSFYSLDDLVFDNNSISHFFFLKQTRGIKIVGTGQANIRQYEG